MSADLQTPSPESLASRTFYWVASSLVFGVFFAYNDIRVYGRENIPDGACVWTPSHRSYIDTPVHSAVFRRFSFMGKQAMWKHPLAGMAFSALGGFPVRRDGSDREAVEVAVERLRTVERPLIVFPEGGRRDGPDIFELQPGAAFLAAKAQVPIVPVGIGGTAAAMPRGAKFMYPNRIRLVIGEPIAPPALSPTGRVPRQAITAIAQTLRASIQALFDEAQERAGTPNVRQS